MSQLRTTPRVRLFEAATLLTIALTAICLAGLTAYAAARHRGLL